MLRGLRLTKAACRCQHLDGTRCPHQDSHLEPPRCERGALLLCYAGVVELLGIAPRLHVYQTRVLLLNDSSRWWAGEDLHPHSR